MRAAGVDDVAIFRVVYTYVHRGAELVAGPYRTVGAAKSAKAGLRARRYAGFTARIQRAETKWEDVP